MIVEARKNVTVIPMSERSLSTLLIARCSKQANDPQTGCSHREEGICVFTIPGATAYTATKAGQVVLVQQLALELARHRIEIALMLDLALNPPAARAGVVRRFPRADMRLLPTPCAMHGKTPGGLCHLRDRRLPSARPGYPLPRLLGTTHCAARAAKPDTKTLRLSPGTDFSLREALIGRGFGGCFSSLPGGALRQAARPWDRGHGDPGTRSAQGVTPVCRNRQRSPHRFRVRRCPAARSHAWPQRRTANLPSRRRLQPFGGIRSLSVACAEAIGPGLCRNFETSARSPFSYRLIGRTCG